MPRLRIIVALGQRQQSFELDDPYLDVGRRADSMLVLPLTFVAETHLTLEDVQGGVLIRPASPTTAVLLGGKPVALAGAVVSATEPFELVIPAPLGLPVKLMASPLPAGYVVVPPTPPAAPPAPPTSPSAPITQSPTPALAVSSAVSPSAPPAAASGVSPTPALPRAAVIQVPAGPALNPMPAPVATGMDQVMADFPVSSTTTTRKKHVPKKAFPSEVTIGAAVLVGVIVVTLLVLLNRPKGGTAGVSTAGGVGAVAGGGAPAATAGPVDIAAMKFATGDLSGAREAINQATQAGTTGPVIEALALAIRNEEARRASLRPASGAVDATAPSGSKVPAAPVEPATSQPVEPPAASTPTTVPAAAAPATQPTTAPAAVVPSTEDREKTAQERAERDAQLRKAVEQAEGDAKAKIDPKLTDLGRAALAAAKVQVSARLAPSQLTFAEDGDTRVVVSYSDGVYTVRGFVEQWNQNKQPVRLFYLTRLRPTGLDTFEHLSTNILQ